MCAITVWFRPRRRPQNMRTVLRFGTTAARNTKTRCCEDCGFDDAPTRFRHLAYVCPIVCHLVSNDFPTSSIQWSYDAPMRFLLISYACPPIPYDRPISVLWCSVLPTIALRCAYDLPITVILWWVNLPTLCLRLSYDCPTTVRRLSDNCPTIVLRCAYGFVL